MLFRSGISLQEDYMWGSNMAICNYARQMKLIGEIDKNVELLDYVQEHFHYLLGKNPVSTCFITGYGTIFPNETHHRPSSAIGKTLKGMLVGGPDRYLEDPYAKSVLAEEPPAKCYIDNIQSYSCNEITIYWNSPFIYLLADMIDNYQ